MDWGFLSEIARNICIPVPAPYNKLLDSKELLMDCYIKVGDIYVPFSNGMGVSYSTFLRETNGMATIQYKKKLVIADLSDVVENSKIPLCDVVDSLSYIMDLYIMGRLHSSQRTSKSNIIIPSNIVFPLIYILNVLKSSYHMEALLTYTLANSYNNVFDKKFNGYTKDDKMELLFYLILLITFQGTNRDIIHRFLRENSGRSRFIDLFSLVRDYLTIEYIESVLPVIRHLAIINNDQYALVTNIQDSIKFMCPYSIINRQRPEIKKGIDFTDKDEPFIIFQEFNLPFDTNTLPRTVTYQMIQDRLPLDINRVYDTTLEGHIVNVMQPYMHIKHNAETETPDITFKIHYVDRDNKNNILIHILSCHLTSDGLRISSCNPSLTSAEINDSYRPARNILFSSQEKSDIKNAICHNIKKDTSLHINILTISFDSIYPDDCAYISQNC